MLEKPDWWYWELELSPHVLKRMIDRDFTESDLRAMLEDADEIVADHEDDRWLVKTWQGGVRWEVILEPISTERLIVVVTAYRVD